ncbi:MAG: polysaccharide biosynthesis tyrosine autokinase [Deltaproteobacteria bacterium]|nr:polysaccharide biosynthesis tyrosine autokinase [Deltaproteobacteria bacterium]
MKEISPYRMVYHPPSPAAQGDYLFEEEEIGNLRDYWIVIQKYRRTILTFFLLVVLITALAILWKVPTYTATATIYVQNQTPNITGVPEALNFEGKGLDYYETQVNLMRSRSLTARVIEDLDLDQDPRFLRTAETPPGRVLKRLLQGVESTVRWVQEMSLVKWIQERLRPVGEQEEKTVAFELGVHPNLINRYLGMLKIYPVSDSQLVNVRFTSLVPSLSKEVVNTHTAAFIRTSLLTRFELTTEARQFLEEKLAELKAEVEKSERALNRFRKAHKIVSIEKGENLVLERLLNLNRNLTQAQARRIELESLYRVVQQKDNRLLSQIIDNPVIQQLKNQIYALEIEQARLATKFKPIYPRVIRLQEQIDQAKNHLDREVLRIVRTIESDYTAAKAKEQALTRGTEEARQAALVLREKAVEYAILEREIASSRTLYENVLKRTKETYLAGDAPMSNVRVVDRAEFPVWPDTTSGKRNLLMSIFVGLLGGVGLAFLRSYLDNTLKTPEDVGRFLRLPTLGVVPDVKQIDWRSRDLGYTEKIPPPHSQPKRQTVGGRRDLVISHHPLSLIAESYRAIRTAILFSATERPPQTILVTSSQPQEGKTVTAINIAMTLAQIGGPVLLIDADLRAGHCHRLLDLENGNGLTNFLTGHGSAAEFIKKTGVNNLYLFSHGEVPPNPAELLGSEKMRQMLESLRTSFPFIVIDSAPLLPIIDTVLLSTMVDGVILVARGQQVSRHIVHKARERLDYIKGKILGVVLNGIDINSPEYKDYRHSYESYYSSYERRGAGER